MSHFQLYFVSLQRIREISGPADWPYVEGAATPQDALKRHTATEYEDEIKTLVIMHLKCKHHTANCSGQEVHY